MTIDHIVPQSLENKLEKLSVVRQHYGLPADFPINDFENWVPAHLHCNGSKNDSILQLSPAMIAVFTEVQAKAVLARDIASKIGSDWHLARIESTIAAAYEQDRLDLETVRQLKECVDNLYAQLQAPTKPLQLLLDDRFALYESEKGVEVRLLEIGEVAHCTDELRIIVRDINGRVTRDNADEHT
ncbi:MAG: hypothetical protein JNN26_22340 [Candidatus Obscuribacter sp.]|nr:hypothetical protein [Candidatus Obscuribacter sp.]